MSHAPLAGAILLSALALAWVPYALLSGHAHPIADDYNLTANAQANGVWRASENLYFDWSGRYSSNPLVLANPLLWGGLSAYQALPLVWLVLTPVAFYGLVTALFRDAMTRKAKANLSLALGLVYFFNAPSLVESLYWYTGAVTYHAAHLLFLGYLAMLVAYFEAASAPLRRLLLGLLALLGFLITGFNETVMLAMLGFHAYASYRSWTLNRRVNPAWALLAAVAVAGAAILMLAPGNAVRGSQFPDRHGLIHSTVYSLFQLVRFSADWVSTAALLVGSVAVAPVIGVLIRQRPIVRRALVLPPVEAALLLPTSILIGVFPPYWVTGILGQHRTLNTAYFLFLLAWLVNLVTWVHMAQARGWSVRWPTPAQAGAAGLAVLTLVATANGYGAAADLLDGSAARFDDEMRARYAAINEAKAAGATHLVVAPITARPHSLFLLDLRPDPNDLVNTGQSAYFGINLSAPAATLAQ